MNLKGLYRKLLKREPDTPFQITTPITELSKIPHCESGRRGWVSMGDLLRESGEPITITLRLTYAGEIQPAHDPNPDILEE